MKPRLIPCDGGQTLNVIGNVITIRLRGCDTGGTIAIVELANKPGEGPPPHVHGREDETFQVLEGEYEVTCGDTSFNAGKGSTFFAPRGVPHSYRCVSRTPGRLLVAITPAGFEGFFAEVGALGDDRQEIPRVIEIGRKYGLEFLPPPGA